MSQAMQAQYSEFFRLMGHRVVETRSALWIDVRPRIFQPIPPFRATVLEASEVRELVRDTGGLACRWFSPSHEEESDQAARRCVRIYIARPPYGLACLHSKARNQTRRGLERVEVRREELDEATERLAYPVYADNIFRLGLLRGERRIRRRWETWVTAVRRSSIAELWCAWQGSGLLAFSVALQGPWGTEIVMQRSLSSGLGLYPNNALVYRVTAEALERGAEVVSFGLGGYASGQDSLDHFKRSMGFVAERMNEHYAWHPIGRLVGSFVRADCLHTVYRAVSHLARLRRAPAHTTQGKTGLKSAAREL